MSFSSISFIELTPILVSVHTPPRQRVVPHGHTSIEVEDRVVFIGPATEIRKAADMVTVET